MGLDLSAFRFLLLKSQEKKFGRTVTLGRQNCHTALRHIKRAGWQKKFPPNFIEEICTDIFGSFSDVDSIDHSNYEGATIVHNMNSPLPKDIQTFDTVLDLGTLEHVFNIRQSIFNTTQLISDGGRIFHVLPANNFGGHGFYQFSPELFFSIYSKKNGFEETEVYLKPMTSSNSYYRVTMPQPGKRFLFNSIYPVYVLVSAKKVHKVEALKVQQSDYLNLWGEADAGDGANTALTTTDMGAKTPLWDRWPIRYFYRPYILVKGSVSSFNPNLSKIRF
tara:strand:- start:589 stop:1419 length:831 start_codon:yes stop_codon:yes gene_type:complete